MADIVLTLKAALRHTIDLSCVVPDRFAGLSNEDLGNLPIWSAATPRNSLRLGDVFSIEGERSATVRVRGDCRMAEGLGREMRGGQLEVEGNVGSHCGTAMQGGTIRVTGDAGDHLAGALAGASRGVVGGEIIVLGSAGSWVAERMRRGLVYVGGSTGEFAGRGMIAGTLVVGGEPGTGAGQGIKRGTLVALGSIKTPDGFRLACTYRPPHVPLILTRLQKAFGAPVTDVQVHGLYRRHSGDLAELGKGEILEWCAA
jgi:formylmethanofuran dehydrogenase subunit C